MKEAYVPTHDRGGMHDNYVSVHCCGRWYCSMCDKHVEVKGAECPQKKEV